MNKIFLIIGREYFTRIRKKSFLLMTLLGPVFFAFIMIVPIWLSTTSQAKKTITVLDHSLLFLYRLQEDESYEFRYKTGSLEEAKKEFVKGGSDALVYIPPFQLGEEVPVQIFSKNLISIRDQTTIERTLSDVLTRQSLSRRGISADFIDNIRDKINISTIDITNEFEEVKNLKALSASGMVSAILIYFFIFLYGVQVMRGVIEEKSNRIIEVIISSVKPFQLMMGKIIGIALLSFTQFFIWITLTFSLAAFLGSYYQLNRFSNENISETLRYTTDIQQALEVNDLLNLLNSINFPILIAAFIFYFLGGYLLYSAMFAAIGSLADNETDTQQFMLPVTIPLIFSFVMATAILENPDSSLAQWMSIIPFTSPIIMMVRIPFGVPWQQIAISVSVLIATFIGITWLAARIYRTGILMYGQKAGLKDIYKWITGAR